MRPLSSTAMRCATLIVLSRCAMITAYAAAIMSTSLASNRP